LEITEDLNLGSTVTLGFYQKFFPLLGN